MAFRFYDCKPLVERHPNAIYYIIFGERSNGKTYSALNFCIERYAKYGEQFVYLRRYDEDIKPKYMNHLFDAHIKNGLFSKYFVHNEYQWNGCEVYRGKLVLTRTDFVDGKRMSVRDLKPCGHLFSLSTWEHAKGVSFPEVKWVIFDEFLTRNGYLYDETTGFANFVSTIVRYRDDVKFFLLGNTVSPFSPYFQEMGIKHVADMKPGTVQVYKTQDGKAEYVLDYCKAGNSKDSDVYFSPFDNEKTEMITKGSWETAMYPRFPMEYTKEAAKAQFYVVCNGEVVRGDVMQMLGAYAIYWTPWTRQIIKDGVVDDKFKNRVIYVDQPTIGKYVKFAMTKHGDDFTRLIIQLIRENRCYYATNRVGETVRAYLQWSDAYSPKR